METYLKIINKKARISPGPLAIANLQGIILKNIC